MKELLKSLKSIHILSFIFLLVTLIYSYSSETDHTKEKVIDELNSIAELRWNNWITLRDSIIDTNCNMLLDVFTQVGLKDSIHQYNNIKSGVILNFLGYKGLFNKIYIKSDNYKIDTHKTTPKAVYRYMSFNEVLYDISEFKFKNYDEYDSIIKFTQYTQKESNKESKEIIVKTDSLELTDATCSFDLIIGLDTSNTETMKRIGRIQFNFKVHTSFSKWFFKATTVDYYTFKPIIDFYKEPIGFKSDNDIYELDLSIHNIIGVYRSNEEEKSLFPETIEIFGLNFNLQSGEYIFIFIIFVLILIFNCQLTEFSRQLSLSPTKELNTIRNNNWISLYPQPLSILINLVSFIVIPLLTLARLMLNLLISTINDKIDLENIFSIIIYIVIITFYSILYIWSIKLTFDSFRKIKRLRWILYPYLHRNANKWYNKI